MEESLRLGTIAGVRVGINWSVLAIFVLLAFGLASGQLPAQFPDAGTAAYVAGGVIAAVVFLLSLLTHEVSHAVVARRNGLQVDGITLWLFGGVARLSGEADSPGAELRIAGIGPLVSLVLAGVFFGLTVAVDAAVGGVAVGVLEWLAAINLALAVFNLVPAAPLDGGRILRAFLWRRRGDKLSAAVTSARAGKAFGFVLIGLGLLQLVLAAGFGGLWLVFIGWFLINAANAEEQFARVRGALGDVRVGDVMTSDPTVVPTGLSVADALDEYVLRNRYSAFPVTADGGRPTGLVTLNRIKAVPPDARAGTAVGDIACPLNDVPTAGPDEPLAELLPRMSGCADGRALVLSDGRLVGIVSPTDVARTLERADLRGMRDAAHV